jgi:hypothetical protein
MENRTIVLLGRKSTSYKSNKKIMMEEKVHVIRYNYLKSSLSESMLASFVSSFSSVVVSSRRPSTGLQGSNTAEWYPHILWN